VPPGSPDPVVPGLPDPGVRREAMWDCKTKDGPWADVCTQHLITHGVENPRLRNKIGGDR